MPDPTDCIATRYGAIGNGRVDDTLACQATLDAAATTGRRAVFPAGDYLIDAARVAPTALRDHDSAAGLIVPSHARVVCAPGARFLVKPTGSPTYACWYIGGGVSDVELNDVVVVGDREAHVPANPRAPGEWGHGIYVGRARTVRIRRASVREVWGDGYCLGSDAYQQCAVDVTLEDCRAARCRRNGGSQVWTKGFRLVRGTFDASDGTNPQAGFGVESDNPACVTEDTVWTGATFVSQPGATYAAYLDGAIGSIAGFTANGCVMRTQAGEEYVTHPDVRHPLWTQRQAIDGEAVFTNCTFVGPMPTCGGCRFSHCTVRLETHTYNIAAIMADFDQPVVWEQSRVLARGTAALIRATNSKTPATEKRFRDIVCTLDGNQAAAGSTKLEFTGYVRAERVDAFNVGPTAPAPGYMTLIERGGHAALIDCYLDATLAVGFASTSGRVTYEAPAARRTP